MKRILMILCCALVLTGCSKKQEITPEVIELEELKGFQPDAKNPDSDNDGILDEDEENSEPTRTRRTRMGTAYMMDWSFALDLIH